MYKIFVSVFKGAEADYMTHNLPFRFLFWKFRETAVRQVSSIDNFDLKQKMLCAVECLQKCIKYIKKVSGSLQPFRKEVAHKGSKFFPFSVVYFS